MAAMIIAVVHTADDAPVGAKYNVAETVGGHLAAVAGSGLEGAKLIAVEAD